MAPRRPVLFSLLLLLAAVPSLRAQANSEEMTPIQLPANPVGDFALFYQGLTGKRIIPDAALAAGGQNLSLVVPQPVSKKEAVALIEAVLILNGYSLVHVDENTVKLLGPSKSPRSESVPLFTDPSQLPPGDQVVSYFMPFRYLKSDEAAATFASYAPNHQSLNGGYVQVPSVNAIVITETATLVRRLIALKDVIDVEGARTATEWFELQRADAENVTEILSKLLEKSDDAPVARNAPPTPNNANPGNPGNPGNPANPVNAAGASPVFSGPAQKVQIFADKRTNRVLVVAPEAQMPYIRTLVENLDVAVAFDDVLERPLRFVRAGDILLVVANLLVEGKGKDGQQPEVKIVGDDQNASGGGANGGGNSSGNVSSGGGSGDSGSIGGQTTSTFSAESTKPLSAIVGNVRIIADRSVNKILVIGPPEARATASRVLDMLDQRPKQVYLACIIGQLQLDNNMEFGIDYLLKFGSVRILGQGTTANVANLLTQRAANIDTVVDTATGAAAAASTAVPALAGLTVFGAIADGVDIVARALASTGRFQIISRPVVYTANGQGALISSGQEVPVATGSQSFVNDVNSNTSAGGTFNTSIDYKKVVLELDVRPLINSDREVTLQIKQKNDTVQSNVTVGNNQVPVIATQTLNTTVTVPNRHTIVIGGLITEQDERNQTGIPFLKDIPGVGYLFSTTTKRKTRRELIIMIQPFIINSDDSLREVQYIERANTNFQKEAMFDKPVPIRAATLPSPEDLTNPKLFR